jgi:flagellar biosynthesis activator protein FlaF
MHAFSYAEVVEDSGATSRERDGKALDVAIELLSRAEAKGAGSVESAEALYFSTRLWSSFIEDLGQPENGLAPDLRAALISVGIGLLREAERIRLGETESFAHMIDVSTIIREGLR